MQDGYSCEIAGDAGLPFGGAGVVNAGALGVDGYCDGHVDDLELVDGLHAEVGEGEDAGVFDGLRDQVGSAAEIGRASISSKA